MKFYKRIMVSVLSLAMSMCLIVPAYAIEESSIEDDIDEIYISEEIFVDPYFVSEGVESLVKDTDEDVIKANSNLPSSYVMKSDDQFEPQSFVAEVAVAVASTLIIKAGTWAYDQVIAANRRSAIMNGWLSTTYRGGEGWTFRVDGRPVISNWRYINNSWYYFNNAGGMYDARYNYRFVAIKGYTYQFNIGGSLVENSGWKRAGQLQNRWAYWIPGKYGAIREGWMTIDGVSYRFSGGYCVTGPGC